VPKRLIGKHVEVYWMDPCFQRAGAKEMLKGRRACATWREYGVIRDITDSIVLIMHSDGWDAGRSGEGDMDEFCYTPVHEALIERIKVFGDPVETLE